jgi:hypothetical protein
MKTDDLLGANFFDSLFNGDQVCHPSSAYFVMFDERNALFSSEIVDHLFVNQRDDYFITANNSPICSSPERERVRARPVNSLIIH